MTAIVTAECNFAIMLPRVQFKISLLPVLSQINTIASFAKLKTRFHDDCLLGAPSETRPDFFFCA